MGGRMMLQTRMTQLFGIRHPIMQGGMQHLGVARFAACVSNAGGLGTINISCFPTVEAFRAELKLMGELTDKPFAVNFSFLPELSSGEQRRMQEMAEACAAAGVPVIETAGGDPSAYLPTFHAGGCKVIHKAPSVKIAKRMEEKGVDAVSIIGYEVAGHPSMDGIGTMVMANKVAGALRVPVLAAGGIADGKGLLAALALGCEGVVMGTRFVATEECLISQAHKDWIVTHGERDSTLIMKSIRNMVRAADNTAARTCLDMERKGATLEELMTVISGAIGRRCYETGDVDGGIFCVGPAMGLIHQVVPVQVLMERMVAEAEAGIGRIQSMVIGGTAHV